MDVHTLDGRWALVTGAASGIGRATALAFGQRGANLVVCDLDPEGLRATVGEMSELRDMIARADMDGDGEINEEEFIRVMTTKTL